jgi:hypothetical protein
MSENIPQTITLEGVEHKLDSFSNKVKHLVSIHTIWKNQLAEQNLEVAKTQAALKSLEMELSNLVSSEVQASKEANGA